MKNTPTHRDKPIFSYAKFKEAPNKKMAVFLGEKLKLSKARFFYYDESLMIYNTRLETGIASRQVM